MARFVVIDRGIVVGVLQANQPPTVNVPAGRIFVNATDLPDVKSGRVYDSETRIFSDPAPVIDTTTADRLAKLESDVETLKKQKV